MAHYPLRLETIEKISMAQTSVEMSSGESLVSEFRSLKMILKGEPPEALRQKCEARKVEIARELLSMNTYPMFYARRAAFVSQINQVNDRAGG